MLLVDNFLEFYFISPSIWHNFHMQENSTYVSTLLQHEANMRTDIDNDFSLLFMQLSKNCWK